MGKELEAINTLFFLKKSKLFLIKSYLFKMTLLLNKLYNSFSNSIVLWWHNNDGTFNFGDELNPYLISRVSKKRVLRAQSLWNRFQIRKIYVCIGSVISKANKNTIVWGAGIISRDEIIRDSIYLAVRGPLTQQRMIECGITPPDVVGDPALLLPLYYQPKTTKKYMLGIIPHIIDFELVKNQLQENNEIVLIDFTKNIENTIDLICSCETIISSSLHGIIVANAYNIPAIWVAFSNQLAGDDVKFYDYFLSVGENEKIEKISIDIELLNTNLLNSLRKFSKIIHPKKESIDTIQKNLLSCVPFN
ncbi:MAG: polysaccharide pyruvyl transferase family protein [Flavobacteriales bacterium]|nr:polysaccharide pyruvyl transferase family protein [Flavobacteriales bacterium]